MKHQSSEDSGLNRRDFIKGAAMGSATLAITGLPQALEAEQPASAARPYAEMRSLPPGAVRPEGWVKVHLEQQARLTNALCEISYPSSAEPSGKAKKILRPGTRGSRRHIGLTEPLGWPSCSRRQTPR